ncbi:MAG: hypothetical protein HY287_01560 [Planctomycetes bacterium]|nr:hypothetical protein [Planctomycetota bacterium]MBI3832995.1 hypothetical protein [Planctomycetota bacterium]
MKALKAICVVAIATMATNVLAQENFSHHTGAAPINAGAQRNGGTVVYQNDFPEADAGCAAGTCDGCGDFFVTEVWTVASTNRRYLSDDITLGAGPRHLVRYDYLVCVGTSAAGTTNVTSELWTINSDGLVADQPGAPIAGTLSTTALASDSTAPCYYVTVKVTPNTVLLPESFHIVLTTDVERTTFPIGTYVAVLDTAEYGSSLNQFRRSLNGVNPIHANTNADWRPPSVFGAAPFCPVAGQPNCTTGCTPYASIWAHVYAESVCGDGVVDGTEQCEPPGSGCCDASCNFVLAGTTCNASTGPCDPAEACTGQSGSCPADTGFSVGNQCRASTGPCDPAEDCDGTSAACPADVHITQCISGDGCCPAGCNNSNDADCPLVVPTVSEWGLALLTLIGVVMGAVVFSRKANVAKG